MIVLKRCFKGVLRGWFSQKRSLSVLPAGPFALSGHTQRCGRAEDALCAPAVSEIPWGRTDRLQFLIKTSLKQDKRIREEF
ncbi:MAG TPA: hypothetical protein DEO89_08225 [Lachnospiraceae bacterium]|nr:hypothetical protein [Lachnospiraceae bacterium]